MSKTNKKIVLIAFVALMSLIIALATFTPVSFASAAPDSSVQVNFLNRDCYHVDSASGWQVVSHPDSNVATVSEHKIVSSSGYAVTLTTGLTRMTARRAEVYSEGAYVDISSISKNSLAFSFWAYAENAVTFTDAIYLQLGGASDGGWYMYPASGAFSKGSTLTAGWNYFYFDIGAALAGDTSVGTIEYYTGAGVFDATKDDISQAKLIYLDFWSPALVEGSEDTVVVFDDFKFLNTTKLDSTVQYVNNEEALKAAISSGAYKNIELTADIAMSSEFTATNSVAISTGDYELTGTDKLVPADKVTVTVDGVDLAPSVVNVSEVTLNKSKIKLGVGEKFTLTQTVLPDNAENKNVTWKSSDDSVATVVNGEITGLKVGSAQITVTTEDGEKEAACTVNVIETDTQVNYLNRDYYHEGSVADWQVLTYPDNTPAVASEHKMISDSGYAVTLTTGTTRMTARYSNAYTAYPDLSKIPEQNLAFSFWIYAEKAVTFTDAIYMGIGGAGEGGWYITPASGAFAPNSALTAGWNYFYFDIGAALADDTSVGIVEYYAGNGIFAANSAIDDISDSKLIYFDFWSPALAAGSEETVVVFDDFKFLNTAKLDSTVQYVNNEEALKAAISSGAYKNIELTADIAMSSEFTATNSVAISTGDYSLAGLEQVSEDTGVTVTVDGEKLSEMDFTVYVTGVTLNNTSINLLAGEEFTLVATIAPFDATNKNVVWESNDKSVVSVTGGVVTALKAGTAVVTVTTEDGAKAAECTVSVTESGVQVEFLNSGNYHTSAKGWQVIKLEGGDNFPAGSSESQIVSASGYKVDLSTSVARVTARRAEVYESGAYADVSSIPKEKLAFTFYVYAEKAVTLAGKVKLQLGGASDGGWVFYPAKGIFSAADTTIDAGWNYFYFDIGAALAGDINAGTIEYYKGAGVFETVKDDIAKAPLIYFDMWDITLAAGSEGTSLVFDDFKFLNTAKLDEAVQYVSSKNAIQTVIDCDIYDNIGIRNGFVTDSTIIIDRDLTIDMSDNYIKATDLLPVFKVTNGATLKLLNGEFKNTATKSLIEVENGAKVIFGGSMSANGFTEIIIDAESGATVEFEDDFTFTEIGLPTEIYGTQIDGKNVQIVAKLPKNTLTGELFANYTKYSDTEYDYYYVEYVEPTVITITSNITEVQAGSTAQFTATFTPADSEKTLVWSVKGNEKVTIDSATGLLTVANDAESGLIMITVTVGDASESVKINVIGAAAQEKPEDTENTEETDAISAESVGLIISIVLGVVVISGGIVAIVVIKKRK